MPKGGRQQIAGLTEGDQPGVRFGLLVRDPQSATLTATIEGGISQIASTTFNRVVDTYVQAETTNAFTASKDTYVYISNAGVLSYLALANGAAPPTQATLGVGALRIAKVVTDGTRITDGGVTDMRTFAPAGDFFTVSCESSFLTANQGAIYIPINVNAVVRRIDGTVTTPLGASDTGTVTVAIGKNDKYTNVTNGVVTHSISAAIGERKSATPTAANFIQAGNMLRVTSLKTTTAGVSHIVITLEQQAA